MPFKVIRGKQYKWAASRSSESRAERLKTKFEKTGLVHAVIHTKKLGSQFALVPTVYEVYVRPTDEGKLKGYTLKSKRLETFIRVKISESVK